MRLSTKNEFTKTEDFPDSDLVVDSFDKITTALLEKLYKTRLVSF